LLRKQDYEVEPVSSGTVALEKIKAEKFDMLLTDIRMSPVDGLELLRSMCEFQPQAPVILLTGYGSAQTAVDAMKGGAFDYVTKPFKVDELLLTVKRALEYHNVMLENTVLRNQLDAKYRLDNIVATSDSMRKVCDMVERIAPTVATVLVMGESGTGKELIAKAIHSYSNRRDEAFIPVNCAAMPEPLLESEMFGHVKGAFTGASADKMGLFEAADGGTIFLDEIGSMPMSIQAKFLRVLQDKEIRRVGGTKSIKVDVRIVAASNESLEGMIEKGTFREDLYYRISVIPIVIEPLRKRRKDILPLVSYFIQQEKKPGSETPRMGMHAQRTFESYNWPGNVRELENAVRHALAFSSDNKITRDNLPVKIINATEDVGSENDADKMIEKSRWKSLKAFLRHKEKEYVSNIIEKMGGDKEKAAAALNISMATLYRKLEEK
jgi:DNA-binding NtrC family response regulator